MKKIVFFLTICFQETPLESNNLFDIYAINRSPL